MANISMQRMQGTSLIDDTTHNIGSSTARFHCVMYIQTHFSTTVVKTETIELVWFSLPGVCMLELKYKSHSINELLLPARLEGSNSSITMVHASQFTRC